ncbi:hypothetical protein NO2_1131 [Candidatus Termititenax persephonae]|uniref:Uncharacterized protein n=1 Tax=Candidatus Termititenax persephonae TaxID=2218525 RepID=A0A388TIK0_9BACT|nr:hypothetical protein NO2_1131 [Candidatus Termititenax persephonae]
MFAKSELSRQLTELENPRLSGDEKFTLLKNLKSLFARKNLRRGLAAVLAKNNLPAKYAALIREIWEAKLLADVRQIALLQYLHLQKSAEWGDLGEQRIQISYCRHFLALPSDREVSWADLEHFQQTIRELSEPYAACSAAELRQRDEAIRCDLLYKETDYSREEDINRFLEFLGSPYGLIAGQLGIYRSIIVGAAEIKKIDKYRVTIFQTEEARTPEAVLSIAAVVGGKHVAIRLQACETIFANKWLNILDAAQDELQTYLRHDLENIGLSFKLRALSGYAVRTAADLREKKAVFLREMLSGLQWHELGHGIVINELLSQKDSAFGEALAVLGANIIAVFKELLADWAPPYKKLRGPLSYFCETALVDPAAAERQISVYLSDNWFLGEQSDESFTNHSEITTALLLKYLAARGQTDFTGLRQALAARRGIFWRILAEYRRISVVLEKMLKAGDFDCGGRRVNFAGLRKIYIQKVRQIEKENPVRSLEFQVHFWAKVLEDLPTLNPALLAQLKDYLSAENEKFHAYLLQEYLPPHSYASLPEYVRGELRQKGFTVAADAGAVSISAMLDKLNQPSAY